MDTIHVMLLIFGALLASLSIISLDKLAFKKRTILGVLIFLVLAALSSVDSYFDNKSKSEYESRIDSLNLKIEESQKEIAILKEAISSSANETEINADKKPTTSQMNSGQSNRVAKGNDNNLVDKNINNSQPRILTDSLKNVLLLGIKQNLAMYKLENNTVDLMQIPGYNSDIFNQTKSYLESLGFAVKTISGTPGADVETFRFYHKNRTLQIAVGHF